MSKHSRIFTAMLLAGGMIGAAAPSLAASGLISNLVTDTVNNSALTTLTGDLSPLIKSFPDLGLVPDNDHIDGILIALRRSDTQEAELQAYIESLSNPASANYQKWLTPKEFGEKYGASEGDLAVVSNWLKSQNLQIDSIGDGHNVIQLSGKAHDVSLAFHTVLHYFQVGKERHHAMVRDPQLPTALHALVAGVTGLNGFPPEAGRPPKKQNDLLASVPGCQYCVSQNLIGPNDFAKIYNVAPLYAANITGTGVTIAIPTHSDVNIQDARDFRAVFGLPAKDPTIIHSPGQDPGVTGGEDEAVLDFELATGIAKNANILIEVGPTPQVVANDVIQNNRAAILNYSFGGCEIGQGTSGNAMINTMWSQAVAEGITVTSSAGDSGSIGCTNDTNAGDLGTGLNGNTSTPYDVSVGGTTFSDFGTQYGSNGAADQSTYWNAKNSTGTLETAKSYIPEIPWNSSCASSFVLAFYRSQTGYTSVEQQCNDPGFLGLSGGGGGPSNCTVVGTSGQPSSCSGGYAKPSWQAGVLGIPADGKRDAPDVSLFGSGGGPSFSLYALCQRDQSPQNGAACNPSTGLNAANSGTSASAPAFAAIMALVDQKQITTSNPDGRQGQAAVVLYKLAAAEYGTTATPNVTNLANCNSSNAAAVTKGSACTFYDITLGDNSQPCHTGTANCVTATAGDQYGITEIGGKIAYPATSGYDMATGLGSVNATNLVNNWSSAGGAPKLTLTPTALSFSNQVVKTASTAHTLTLKNTGLEAAIIKSYTVAGDYTQTNNCPASLAGGASCTISVVFTPTTTGSRPGSVSVTSSAPTVAASLSGVGTAPLPTLNMTVSNSTIYLVTLATATNPNSSVLSWSTTNATACTATSNLMLPNKTFSGSEAVSGTLTVMDQVFLSYPATLTVSLTCTGVGGSVTKSVSITEKALQAL